MRTVRRVKGVSAVGAAFVLTALVGAEPARAWLAGGHAHIAEAAARLTPPSMPDFFRSGSGEVGRSAIDPDYYRLRDLPQLRDAISPEHYLDVELLEGAEWPPTRSAYMGLLARLELSPFKAGTLPYSLAEGVQLLAASFAQVRLDPDDEWARARALYHAGIMAHYSADLCQPLHTTIHFNGRAKPDGSSPSSGIHFRTDGLVTPVFKEGLGAVGAIEAYPDLRAAIEREFRASHALVDRVYELEEGLGPESVSPDAMEFARERIAASVRFTASLFVTAWDLSEKLSLPDWYMRLQGASDARVESADGSKRPE